MDKMARINKFTYGIDTYMNESEYLDLMRQNVNYAEQAKIEEVNRQVAVMEAAERADAIMTGILQHKANEGNLMRSVDALYSEGRNIVFKSIICEAFIKSLPIDSDYVSENVTQLSAVMCDYIDQNGGIKLLENARKTHRDSVPFLSRLEKICNEVALETATRIYGQGMDDPELVHDNVFRMNSDEKSKMEDKKENLSLEQITNNIKDKVVRVVGEEIERGRLRKELAEDLESLTTEMQSVKEAANLALGDMTPVYESTLFNALMNRNFKESVKQIQIVMEATKPTGLEDDFGDQLVGTTDDVPEPMKNDIDMDMIMCESIVDYTVLDVMRTLRLQEFKPSQVRETVGSIMNG